MVVPQYDPKEKKHVSRKTKVARAKGVKGFSRMKRFTHKDPYEQMDMNSTSLDFANKVVKKNLYTMCIADHKLGYILFIGGRVAACPAHFIDYIETKV